MSSSLTTLKGGTQVTIATVGLTEVFASEQPQVDIVLVHGLNGNPEKTWTADNGTFWPRDLLPNHLGNTRCRILTYGYDARVSAFTDGVGKDTIHHHAENLAARLYSNRSLNNAVERPIIFVVHSLGGLVTKQCLIYSRSIEHENSAHLRSIHLSTYGILFMGTPHNGSDLAKWGTLLQSIAHAALPKKFFDSSPQLVEALKSNNETLQNINRHFNEILPRLHIFFFYEGKPMDLKGTRQFVVDEDSAAPNFPGVERMGIERDHSTMCKFSSETDTGFAEVVEAIRRYSTDAPATINVRWLEERHHRYIRQELGAPDKIAARSGNSSPDARRTDGAPTPLLPSNPNTPLLIEPGSASIYTPYEIEEHEDPSKSKRLSHSTLAQDVPVCGSSGTSTRIPPKLIRPRLVAPLGFRPNTHFVGFDIEMARMVRKLADEKRGRLGTRSVLLYGPPGSGKSHLAREFVWRHVDRYPNGIFWIDCKTPESLNKGFWNIAQTLGCFDDLKSNYPDGFIDAVRSYLSEHDKWLLVFDGLSFKTEPDLEAFKRYVPDHRPADPDTVSTSNIIITTVDKTLTSRQRLLDPPGIKLYPLTTDQVCILLYKSLNFREPLQPTKTQQAKAEKLVAFYDCLPLGIHAAAHMLLARGRALEKYSQGPTDNRLATPFLSILDALERTHHREAINLLMIMCFLNHEVPVAMLHFGHTVLSEMAVEIRAFDKQSGSTRRELDISISTLIKNGLIERRLQAHSSGSSEGRSSPEASRHSMPQQNGRQASEPAPDHDDDDDRDDESQKSSVTFVGIDVIRIHTIVQQVYLDQLKAFYPIDFSRWLVIASRFVIAAWNYAHDRIKVKAGRGSASDYREFENHAEKVWSHFPTRPDGASQSLRQARHDLHLTRRIIKREVDNQSPSQSSQASARAYFHSIFERSGSSSDEGPATPTSGLTRVSTWSLDPSRDAMESPVELQQSTYSNLPVSLENSWHDDAGYLSDNEQRPSKGRTFSQSTTRTIEQQRLDSIFEGRSSNGTYRPVPVVGSVSSADIPAYTSRSNSVTSQPARPFSTPSLAESTLSGVHRASPPAKLGRPPVQITERRPLSELSSNQPITQPGLSSRTISASPHLRHAVLTNTLQTTHPSERNSSVTLRSQPLNIMGRAFKPSLPTLESHSLPAGFEPVPMSREANLSHESKFSAQTEPVDEGDLDSINDGFVTPNTSTSPTEVAPRSPSRVHRADMDWTTEPTRYNLAAQQRAQSALTSQIAGLGIQQSTTE